MSTTDPTNQQKVASRLELYTHEPMVNWLGPSQLLQTGLRVAVATTLGSFADPREVQAALHPLATNPVIQHAGVGEVWVDYVADTGDGWDATHSVAWCVAQDSITVNNQPLPRAQVLLLGGDQVYPTPANCGYRTRFLDPFRSAFPAAVLPDSRPGDHEAIAQPGDPLILATPGNHDWYDGLRAFAQLFCNQHPIGRWRTVQRTSYFALKLPHGWWIWGLDLQLESAIDRPQREYFEAIAKQLQGDDRVILCTPEPSWIDESQRLRRMDESRLSSGEKQAPRFRSLREIEELLGARLAATLAGDLHLYARYQATSDFGPQRITCGGGGSFMLGTHHLPEELNFSVNGKKQAYDRKAVYPGVEESRQWRNRAWRLPTRNASFCVLLSAVYLLFLWSLQSASKMMIETLGGVSLMESLSVVELTGQGVLEVIANVLRVLAHSPSTSILALAVIAGAGQFTRSAADSKGRWAFLGGMVHGFIHLTLAIAMLWIMGTFNLIVLPAYGWRFDSVDDPAQVVFFVLQTVFFGGGVGGIIFGLWLVLTNKFFSWHGQEVFSSQRIGDCKCFLRMRIDQSGLTIHPLKIAKVCTEWKLGPNVKQEKRDGENWMLRAFVGATSRFIPKKDGSLRAELIEPAILIKK